MVRVYTPIGDGPFPGHLYLHGGGFWLGAPSHFDTNCQAIAAGAGCVVASVDYRLAPEAKFPIPPEDCYTALLWFVEHADELGVDRARISVGGGSAGGNLSAVVALDGSRPQRPAARVPGARDPRHRPHRQPSVDRGER